jgi:hypothetical protein
MALHNVQNHVFEVWTGLVGRHPTALRDLKTSAFDQLLYYCLCLVILDLVPHTEELHLDVGEPATIILL